MRMFSCDDIKLAAAAAIKELDNVHCAKEHFYGPEQPTNNRREIQQPR